ncbi:endolytic transglycosylase MltG [Falsiroseomonas tokyonensis]|uniref:Endolytic murein transglycosylase n=1 Tax=Falsiroseomonas tokyonensis TaxID=430521 RepID=A0ABV7BMI9_9PROT|nr:endolytic transglycosylase MltG [Falsiroseomonas tokyonensis]MBU8536274.1 endolytic transglycosylase MltG [Falsiroseomonas tokyonensis]
MRRLIALLLFLLILAAGAGGAFWYAREQWTAPGPLAEPVQMVVPRGGTTTIADALAERGIIAQPLPFLAATWLTRGQGPLRAAEFQFPARASLRDVLQVLREARPVQRRLTIPEGLTVQQITRLLEQAEGLTGDTPSFAEGEILPETYAYQWGDNRAALLRRAKQAMDQALAEIWAARAPNLPIDTAREALILASIVERETGQRDERALVAGVFLNRLRRGMPLQSDPTAAYAAADGGVLDRALTRADLDRDHPFNTYRIRGLPPAPIASPGREALRAVARPEATEFIYFVADGTGGHAFARTLEEHNRNVARWREIERSRAPQR